MPAIRRELVPGRKSGEDGRARAQRRATGSRAFVQAVQPGTGSTGTNSRRCAGVEWWRLGYGLWLSWMRLPASARRARPLVRGAWEGVGVRPVGDAYATGAPAFTGCARAGRRPAMMFSMGKGNRGISFLSRRRLTGGRSERGAAGGPCRPALPVRCARARRCEITMAGPLVRLGVCSAAPAPARHRSSVLWPGGTSSCGFSTMGVSTTMTSHLRGYGGQLATTGRERTWTLAIRQWTADVETTCQFAANPIPPFRM